MLSMMVKDHELCAHTNVWQRYGCAVKGERNQESADERIQTSEQSAAAISRTTCSDPNGCDTRFRSGSFGAHDNLGGSKRKLCHSTDATEFMTQLIAEAETVFYKYSKEKF
jgi:hypothetical protein